MPAGADVRVLAGPADGQRRQAQFVLNLAPVPTPQKDGIQWKSPAAEAKPGFPMHVTFQCNGASSVADPNAVPAPAIAGPDALAGPVAGRTVIIRAGGLSVIRTGAVIAVGGGAYQCAGGEPADDAGCDTSAAPVGLRLLRGGHAIPTPPMPTGFRGSI